MLSSAQFARCASLTPGLWPQLSPGSPLSWELATAATPFSQEVYLRASCVPASVLRAPSACTAPTLSGPAPVLGAAAAAAAAAARGVASGEAGACIEVPPLMSEEEHSGDAGAVAAPAAAAAAAAAAAREGASGGAGPPADVPRLVYEEEHSGGADGAAAAVSPEFTGTPSSIDDEAHIGAADDATAGTPHVRHGPGAPAAAPQHMYDLHVIRHPSYQVPTLLLRGYQVDGQPLVWQEVASDFPQWQDHLRSAGADWAFIVPEVHPLLQQPGWLMLHPCQTSAVLQLLLAQVFSTDGKGRDAGTGTGSSTLPGSGLGVGPAGREDGDAGDDVPDIDLVVPCGATCHEQQQQQQEHGILPEGSSDDVLRAYMAAWLRVVCPVVGLQLPVPTNKHHD